MTDDAILIDGALHDRLAEWGRWARVSRHHAAHCRSIESRYRPEAGEVWDRDYVPRVPVDELDAWAVECAWRSKLQLADRFLLRAYYVTAPSSGAPAAWRRHVALSCRLAGIRRAEWGTRITSAALKLGEHLTAGRNIAKIAAVSFSVRAGAHAPVEPA